MKAGTNTLYHNGRKVSSAMIFVLAVLLLVVSCPLKRFLQTNAGSSITFQKGTKAQTITNTNYKAASCCSIKKKVVLVEAAKLKQTKPASTLLTIYNQQSGFSIHHYLSSLDAHVYPSGSIKLSSLPLFLQHRRLLI
ncbi:hypothetical protein SAMN05444410_101367 [Hydrobacter penzbergensis]|jgi:hypothetical protein|uniref:Uncharacterized protein n=1 Tax=Hydrobacter penzbergensis TaxID=1235997 RepID=A0A8X8ID02_9BACT|nr:hypothetical protein [Hydrobacter penzbergensis]MBN8717988.1 hypothetical protein [Sediminibacterium magnilacihabitans]PQV61582.1 hypothetical protein CLV53_102194 [Sediminibacterium magnilacihabitans]SDW15525.1 hypothetical protein SAMN05444410_101367 [Hydrobacter penzbergensis]